MLSSGERVIVAVSGGPDSVCLLHLLQRISPEFNLELFVVHLNHMLREEATVEEEFVRKMAEDMSLPFYSEQIDVRALLGKGETLEEGARRIRYDFLRRVSERFSASKVALGHNADDLVETVIFNLTRGTGLRGMRGIPPIRKEEKNIFIRPLINIWREEIEEYLRENQIPYMIDRSNLSLQFTRNKIRHQIIPLLIKINPRAKEAIHRLALIASEAYSLLREEAERRMEELIERRTKSLLQINLAYLSSLHPALGKEALRITLGKFVGDMSEIGSEEVERILEMEEGEALSLPGNLQARRRGETLLLRKGKGKVIPYEVTIQVPGWTSIPQAGLEIEAKIVEGNFLIKDPACLEVTLDMDKITGRLVARNWRTGDKMVPLGMSQPKKLQDIFVDCKVSREERHRIPIVCDEEGILWIVGLRISEQAKVRYETKRVLHLKTVSKKEVLEE